MRWLNMVKSIRILLICFLLMNTLSIHVNGQIRETSSIFEKSEIRQLIKVSQMGLANKIDESIIDHGITLKLKELYYFDNEISYSVVIETDNRIKSDIEQSNNEMNREPWRLLGRPHIKYNDKSINFASRMWTDRISDNKYMAVITIFPETNLSGEGILELHYEEVMMTKNGSWNFKIPIREVDSKKITFENLATKDGRNGLKINYIKMNPAEISISLNLKQDLTSQEFLTFNLLTEQGELLERFTGVDSGLKSQINKEQNTKTTQYFYKFASPKEGTKELILSPFLEKEQQPIKKSVIELNPGELPIKLSQGETGYIEITDINYMKDKTLITFDSHIKFPFEEVYPQNNVWLEGKSHSNKSNVFIVRNLLGHIKPIGVNNSYVGEYSLTKKDDQYLNVASWQYPHPKILKKLEINIPLSR